MDLSLDGLNYKPKILILGGLNENEITLETFSVLTVAKLELLSYEKKSPEQQKALDLFIFLKI
ncbi:hypothetical protein CBP27_11005 [Fischerella thermalis WC542]|uniref:hypothetical protein n=1 Tax=Fischerella thermalis TaxID=372787 RepID=UPI000C8033F9|nr:hypothetical protein [Fischerella thermalis]PLZ30310.1 hypothetical protein CBP28_08355 [Fischerella thermalis WC559]PLZ37283.1 hypothetical protein CBP27_11005 [Fischerella thermalis WC542]